MSVNVNVNYLLHIITFSQIGKAKKRRTFVDGHDGKGSELQFCKTMSNATCSRHASVLKLMRLKPSLYGPQN